MGLPVAESYEVASGGVAAAGRYYVSPFYRDLAAGWTQLVITGQKPGGGILAYSGMALDEVGGKLYVIGGGHQDAPNDEPWVLDIEARTNWVQAYAAQFGQNPPLASAQSVTDNVNWPGAIVVGGVPVKPISRHTYKAVHWIDSIKRMTVGGSSTYSGSGSDYLWLGQPGGGAWLNDPRDFWTYEPVSKTFAYKGSQLLNPAYDLLGSVHAYSKQRDRLYCVAVNSNNSLNMRSWNPHTNVWTLHPNIAVGNICTDRLFCVDSTRNKLLIVSRDSTHSGLAEVWEFDPDTELFTQLPSTGDVPSLFDGTDQVVYSPVTDRVLLLRNSTDGMHVYDRATGVWTQQPVPMPNLLQVEGRWVFDSRRGCAFLLYNDAANGVRLYAFKE